MADIEGLAKEMNEDPLNRGYSSMSDQQVADDLNTSRRTKYRDVPVAELVGVVELRGIYEKLESASTTEAAKLLRLSGNKSPITSLAYSDSSQRTQIDGLLDQLAADGIISSEDQEALKDLGTYKVSRAEELGLLGASPSIGPAHVNQARNS